MLNVQFAFVVNHLKAKIVLSHTQKNEDHSTIFFHIAKRELEKVNESVDRWKAIQI